MNNILTTRWLGVSSSIRKRRDDPPASQSKEPLLLPPLYNLTSYRPYSVRKNTRLPPCDGCHFGGQISIVRNGVEPVS